MTLGKSGLSGCPEDLEPQLAMHHLGPPCERAYYPSILDVCNSIECEGPLNMPAKQLIMHILVQKVEAASSHFANCNSHCNACPVRTSGIKQGCGI